MPRFDQSRFKPAESVIRWPKRSYAQKMAETDNPKIKKSYHRLIDVEKMPARLLRSCLNFVEDSAEWFRKRDSK